jgi:hypothetical protein
MRRTIILIIAATVLLLLIVGTAQLPRIETSSRTSEQTTLSGTTTVAKSSNTGHLEAGQRGTLSSDTPLVGPLEAGEAGTFCEAYTAIIPIASDGIAQVYDDFTDGKRVYDPSCLIYPGADPKTFLALSYYYKKDSTHVWVDSDVTGNDMIAPMLIAGADPATFSLIPDTGVRSDHGYSKEYTKDKDHVYLSGLEIVAGADPATFAVNDPPGAPWCQPYDAYDAHHFYRGAEIVTPPSTSTPVSYCP